MNVIFEKYLNKIKSLKSFRIIIIPDNPGAESKSTKLTLSKLLKIILIYSIIIFILGFFIIGFSPIADVFIPTKLNSEDIREVKQLNKRIYFLAKELESLKSTNEKLRYALVLGDSTLIDSLNEEDNEDTTEITDPFDGNVFAIFNKIISGDPVQKIQQEYIYFTRPSNGFVSNSFNPEKGHMGIDYVLKSGSPVYATASGYVVFAEYTLNSGYTIIINHPGEYVSIYKHCSNLLKKERDTILQGELIALSGNTGEKTTGPHLHFELWQDGKPIDPEKVFTNY